MMNRDEKIKELQMLTIKEVQEILGYSKSGIYNLIYTGELPAHKPVGKWLIRLSDVEEFLNRNEDLEDDL